MMNAQIVFHSRTVHAHKGGLKASLVGKRTYPATIDVFKTDNDEDVLRLTHSTLPKNQALEMSVAEISDITYVKRRGVLKITGLAKYVTDEGEVARSGLFDNEIPMSLGIAMNTLDILEEFGVIAGEDMQKTKAWYKKQLKNVRVHPHGIDPTGNALDDDEIYAQGANAAAEPAFSPADARQ